MVLELFVHVWVPPGMHGPCKMRCRIDRCLLFSMLYSRIVRQRIYFSCVIAATDEQGNEDKLKDIKHNHTQKVRARSLYRMDF